MHSLPVIWGFSVCRVKSSTQKLQGIFSLKGVYDSGNTDERWGVMCTDNAAVTGTGEETSTVSSSAFG